jgi:hypothetical protein
MNMVIERPTREQIVAELRERLDQVKKATTDMEQLIEDLGTGPNDV